MLRDAASSGGQGTGAIPQDVVLPNCALTLKFVCSKHPREPCSETGVQGMETDGNGTLVWPDPDLDFWPMSELSALNLSWLDQAELQGNSDALEPYDRLMAGGEAKATNRGGQEASERVSPSTRLTEERLNNRKASSLWVTKGQIGKMSV